MVNEITVRESFRRVKNDILDLQKQITDLAESQQRMMEIINENTKLAKTRKETKTIVKTVTKKAKPAKRTQKKIIGSKTGSKVHIEDCPFAKNIQPKNRVYFSSKRKALNEGYKACECLKK